MKTVILCRHAKAEPGDDQLSDFHRKLLTRGKKTAERAGLRLQKKGITVDCILSSSAKRAAQTATIIARAVGLKKKQVELCESLYQASPADLLDTLRGLPEDVGTVVLVGHNPSIAELVCLLVKDFEAHLPTCAVVGTQFNIERWKNIKANQGRLYHFDFPNYRRAQQQPLQDFQTKLSDSLRASIQKQLVQIDAETAQLVNASIAEAVNGLAKDFAKALCNSRKFADLPKLSILRSQTRRTTPKKVSLPPKRIARPQTANKTKAKKIDSGK